MQLSGRIFDKLPWYSFSYPNRGLKWGNPEWESDPGLGRVGRVISNLTVLPNGGFKQLLLVGDDISALPELNRAFFLQFYGKLQAYAGEIIVQANFYCLFKYNYNLLEFIEDNF